MRAAVVGCCGAPVPTVGFSSAGNRSSICNHLEIGDEVPADAANSTLARGPSLFSTRPKPCTLCLTAMPVTTSCGSIGTVVSRVVASPYTSETPGGYLLYVVDPIRRAGFFAACSVARPCTHRAATPPEPNGASGVWSLAGTVNCTLVGTLARQAPVRK